MAILRMLHEVKYFVCVSETKGQQKILLENCIDEVLQRNATLAISGKI